ncbi:MAG: filamentous hemagglutinin N-terminal domain-containing protein [Calothrix sp. FI2-JRJ7]|jgi:filamentous hemagglutinin family protein|nr:filamentous hemagglutinin N-terminal domain-containing protein [Calothrix sp. FI2-JRJ7]
MQFKWLQQAKFAFYVLFFTIQYPGFCNAQIIPDATLPTQSTVQLQDNTQLIEGGTRAGNNLFHSFSEFSVPNNSTAFFNNPADVQNILTRVTGSARSDINGIIKANDSANLFLINPNGIIFGLNARLDIGGSFIGSTANAIGFGRSGNFSATNPEAPSPLLTINPSALLFSQIQRSSIETSSVASDGRNPSNAFEARGLRVDDGKSLLLVGGDVSVNGGGLYAFGGRVELGGLAGVGTVGLNGDGGNFSLTWTDGIQRSDISLSNNALVNVRAGNGGSIGVNANNLDMTENSQVLAGIESRLGSDNSKAGSIDINATRTVSLEQSSGIFNDVQANALGQGGDVNIRANTLRLASGGEVSASTLGVGQGGDLNINTGAGRVEVIGTSSSRYGGSIFASAYSTATGAAGNLTIKTGELIVQNGGQVVSGTFGAGQGGNLTVDATRKVELTGVDNTSNNNPSALFAGQNRTDATGNAGRLTIDTPLLRVLDRAIVSAGTSGAGRGGDLTINTDQLIVQNGGRVDASTSGAGDSGNININSTRTVQLSGTSVDGKSRSGLLTVADLRASGKAGDITVQTGELLVENGAEVSAKTFSPGNAGKLTVTATNKVELVGVSRRNSNDTSGLFTETGPGRTGDAGSLTINTPLLRVLDGAKINASTFGTGQGGNLNINSTRTVQLSGTSVDGESRSGLLTVAYRNASGKAGDITVQTGELLVENGAEVSAKTFSPGNAGKLSVTATNKVELVGVSPHNSNDTSGLFTQTGDGRTGDAGILTINTPLLRVLDGAYVSASTSGAGRGGDLNINTGAGRVEVIGTPSSGDPSSIKAQAESTATGAAGNLTINTGELIVQNGGRVDASTFGAGQGGNLNINSTRTVQLSGTSVDGKSRSGLLTVAYRNASRKAGDITVQTGELLVENGAEVSAKTFSPGNAGKLTVIATNKVELAGVSPHNSNDTSGLFTQTGDGRTGDAGSLTINTPLLQVKDGAYVSASTSGAGRGGDLNINTGAGRVEVIGTSSSGNPSSVDAQTNPRALGKAGNLTINTGELIVQNGGQIRAITSGAGTGGNLTVDATSKVELIGRNTVDSRFPSGLFTQQNNQRATGNAGNLTINTPLLRVLDKAYVSAGTFGAGRGGDLTINVGELLVKNEAVITARSLGTGTAGNLTIDANSINLDNNALLTANTFSNKTDVTQATIKINSADLIMRRGSQITTNAFGSEVIGGNININTDVLALLQGSNITANSLNSRGGNINIKTQGLFRSLDSSITATGATSALSGNINITTLADPSKDLVPLTVDVVDVARLVDDNICVRTANSSFTVIGRGGIPSSPDNPAVSNSSWEDWRLLEVSKQQRSVTVRNTPISNTSSSISNQIVEAQRWVIDKDGSVILTAAYPVSLSQNNVLSQCQ